LWAGSWKKKKALIFRLHCGRGEKVKMGSQSDPKGRGISHQQRIRKEIPLWECLMGKGGVCRIEIASKRA